MNYLIESIESPFNFLTVLDNKLYWAGFPVSQLEKTPDPRNKHEYFIISYGWTLGKISLSEENFKQANILIS